MEKVLNQAEIDAMVRAARGGAAEAAAKPVVVAPWDIRQAGQMGREQVQAISDLHEAFARNLTHAVAAYLRVAFKAALVSAEHLAYREFLQRVPEVTYLATCTLAPVGATALLQLDLTVAFPLIDVLLGGEGRGKLPERQITGIEEQILETVMRIIVRELQAAWQILGLQFAFEERQQAAQLQQLMPAEERTLSLSFELTVAESRGTLNLVFPAIVSNALLRKMAADLNRTRRRIQPDSERVRARLLECPLTLELGVRIPNLPVAELMRLSPGRLLPLHTSAEQPAELQAAGHALFIAMPARRGADRVAQVVKLCPLEQSGETAL
ncbi:MAG: FliM/FliN family flagellar motor switch protein [Terriglobales bacterium]